MAVKAMRKWTPYREWEELDLVLDLDQVCGVLRISRPTATALLQSGELPGALIGAQWRISRDALRAKLGEITGAQAG